LRVILARGTISVATAHDHEAYQEPIMSEHKTPVLLAILDGWGIGRDEPGNAILQADTPVMDRLLATYPHATLRTSGEDVGLPAGQMGNSEVGHLNIGAGFIVYQWITRIDRAIADGTFATNVAFDAAFSRVRSSGGALHLMGLTAPAGPDRRGSGRRR
jgi:2,3-bisphosphoglycerate-independent phosphoglycerate mutase